MTKTISINLIVLLSILGIPALSQKVSLVQMMEFTLQKESNLPQLRIKGFYPPTFERSATDKNASFFIFDSHLTNKPSSNSDNPFAKFLDDQDSTRNNPLIIRIYFILNSNKPLWISASDMNKEYFENLKLEAKKLKMELHSQGWDTEDRMTFTESYYNKNYTIHFSHSRRTMFPNEDFLFDYYNVQVFPNSYK